MNSSRELARIVSIQKSPIINLFEESIAGASAIRAFGQEKRFMKKNLQLIDSYNRPFFYSFTAIEWLCLRMEILSTLVFAFCMVFLVTVPRGTIDASMCIFLLLKYCTGCQNSLLWLRPSWRKRQFWESCLPIKNFLVFY